MERYWRRRFSLRDGDFPSREKREREAGDRDRDVKEDSVKDDGEPGLRDKPVHSYRPTSHLDRSLTHVDQ